MKLDRFGSTFQTTEVHENFCSENFEDPGIENLSEILGVFGGRTFNHGLYRVFLPKQVPSAITSIEGVFPEYRGRLVPFGFDWLGRHFACDRARVQDGQPQVLLLEIGAGEAMEIPASILDFHNIELVDYMNDALAVEFWERWRAQNPTDLSYTECVGYKVPLFLGGDDTLPNLEVIDLNVYVEICGQLRNRVKTLPVGQTIRSFSMQD